MGDYLALPDLLSVIYLSSNRKVLSKRCSDCETLE